MVERHPIRRLIKRLEDRGTRLANEKNPELNARDLRLAGHKCQRWWKRGLTCPFLGEEDHIDDETPEVVPLPTLSKEAEARAEGLVSESAVAAKVPARAGAVVAKAIAEGQEMGFTADVAEEGAADAVSERVFDFPGFQDVAGPLAAAETLRRMQHGALKLPGPPPRGGGGGGFFFESKLRMGERMIRKIGQRGGAGPPGGPSHV